MILTRTLPILITEQNYSYYNMFMDDLSYGHRIEVPVEFLPRGSHYKIECKCDNCGTEKPVIFKNYIKYGNNWGEYFCRKCSEFKRKKSLIDNYGCEYPIQSDIIKDRIGMTILTKWGVDTPLKLRGIKKVT